MPTSSARVHTSFSVLCGGYLQMCCYRMDIYKFLYKSIRFQLKYHVSLCALNVFAKFATSNNCELLLCDAQRDDDDATDLWWPPFWLCARIA